MKPLKISAIQAINNAIDGGYPFIEAIISALPVADEFLINEGGSKDKTLFYLKKLEKLFPNKIQVFNKPFYKSNIWETIDDSIEFLISKSKGDWIFEVQGDEVWHENDIFNLKRAINFAFEYGYNSIRTTPYWCDFSKIFWDKYRNIRVFKKKENIKSNWGGDDFQIGDNKSPSPGFTSSNLPPEMTSGLLYYNFDHTTFPKNSLERTKNIATFIAQKDEERTREWDRNKNTEPQKEVEVNLDLIKKYPALMQGLAGLKKYKARDELFDKKFLSKLTGIDYTKI